MEQIDIKSGVADIISSGTIIAFKGNPIEIIFGKTKQLKIILKFENEIDKSEPRVVRKVIAPKTLEFTFFNFKDPLGLGNLEPYLIGRMNGRKLYFSYRIYPLKEKDSTIHYTIYMGEEEVRK